MGSSAASGASSFRAFKEGGWTAPWTCNPSLEAGARVHDASRLPVRLRKVVIPDCAPPVDRLAPGLTALEAEFSARLRTLKGCFPRRHYGSLRAICGRCSTGWPQAPFRLRGASLMTGGAGFSTMWSSRARGLAAPARGEGAVAPVGLERPQSTLADAPMPAAGRSRRYDNAPWTAPVR